MQKQVSAAPWTRAYAVLVEITCQLPGCTKTKLVPPKELRRGGGKYCGGEHYHEARKGEALRKVLTRITPPIGAGCAIWTGAKSGGGYGQMRVNGVLMYVHRYIWEQANRPLRDGEWICHTCDVPACCRLEHLFLCNAEIDSHDMVAKGRHFAAREPERHREVMRRLGKTHIPVRGEQHHATVLTDTGVVDLRRRYAEHSATVRELAAEYGVSVGTIYNVLNRKTWTHLP